MLLQHPTVDSMLTILHVCYIDNGTGIQSAKQNPMKRDQKTNKSNNRHRERDIIPGALHIVYGV